MNTHSTGQLSDTCNRQFYFLACCHNQIAELIDDNHNIWHKFVSVVRIQLTVFEFLVVFLNVSCSGLFEQVVSGIHFHTKALQRLNHFVDIRDDGFFRSFVALHLCQEVVHDGVINAELHLLGVNHHELQFSWMLLI